MEAIQPSVPIEKNKPSISVQCPHHPSHLIGMLDLDPTAKKLGYCYGCIAQGLAENTFPRTPCIRTFPDYLKETSDFYQRCRQRVTDNGEPPRKVLDELSRKAERLEKLSKHIDQEKQEVKEKFEDIRKEILQVIESKEKECLQLLDNEISILSEKYREFERVINTGWMKPAEIDEMYPTADLLEQRVSKIVDLSQLETFVRQVKKDIEIAYVYFDEKMSLETRKNQMKKFTNYFQTIAATSRPQLQGYLLTSQEYCRSFTKVFFKEFTQQEIFVKDSLEHFNSKIIGAGHYEILRSWVPGYKTFELELLYRGSQDGMSPQMFHTKCNDKGATFTLIKCKFPGALDSSVIGGFTDQSWNSSNKWIASNQAFLFSFSTEAPSVKCPIIEPGCATCGLADHGPRFGAGPDLLIDPNFKSGSVNQKSYHNSLALRLNNEAKFAIEEIEVFQMIPGQF